MSIQINFFGSLVDTVGKSQMDIREVDDTDTLKQKLLIGFPKLKNYHFVIAVGKQIANGNQTLKSGDVVALLPPFAGG
jgi:molybdopterin converting factor small subunit